MTDAVNHYIIDPATTSVVWFDLDDTLIDFMTNSRRALARLYESQGLNRFFATAQQWVDTYEHFNHMLWSKYSAARIDQPTLRMDRFRLPLEAAGADTATATELSASYDTLYLDYLAAGKAMIPGAMELLQAVSGAGITTGILSNGFTGVQHRKIANTGISHLINIIVLSDDIGINKPDVRIFAHAMERSGVSDPGRHLMIGDNPATDIAGAVGAGWRALHFLRTPASGPSTQAPAIASLKLISVANNG